MTCPHCNHALTDAEIRRLWAQRNAKRQTPHAGPGRPRKDQQPKKPTKALRYEPIE